MYQIQQVIGLPIATGSKWIPVDVSSILVNQLFRQYKKLVMVLQDDVNIEDVINVDLDKLRATYSQYNNTLAVFIQSLGNGFSYPTLLSLPNSQVGYVTYNHAYQAGYKSNLAKAGINYEEGNDPELLTDIILTRPELEIDTQGLFDYCLPSVNGFFHQFDFDGTRIFVKDGGVTVKKSNNNQVGLYNFKALSKLTVLPVTEDKLSIPTGFSLIKDRVRITLPNTYSVKSFFIVVGGYVIWPQTDVFWQDTDHSFILNLNRLPILERVLESRDYISLDSLELPVTDTAPNSIYLNALYSDAVLTKYLCLSQSFIVLIDTPNLFTNQIKVRAFREPGLFSTLTEPKYPLFLGTGRVVEYWKEPDGERWALTFTDNFRRMYMHYYDKLINLNLVQNQLRFDSPYHFSEGSLVEIGSYQNQEV